MDPDNLPAFVELHKNHKHTLKLGFYAAPSNPKIFSKAVKDELNKLKFTYCSDLNGLIMGFGKINSNEVIQADIRHCISVVINVDVYIFRPPVGSIIEAIVNQTSDNHVSCLVHNLFNVSIVRPENQPYHQWSGSKVYKDDKINVKVLSFDLTKKLPHITGNIVDNEKDECYTYNNDQNKYSGNHSSTEESFKSFDLKNDIFNNYIKRIETDDSANSSKLSMNDSESSDEEENTAISHSKVVNDKYTKVSSLFNNSVVKGKHIEKEDTASSSKLPMNDSESSDEEENTAISRSKVVNDKHTKVSSLFNNSKHIKGNHIEKEDTASSSKLPMNDSESSDEEENTAISHSKVVNDKHTKDSSLFNNSKHIKGKHIEKKDTTSSSKLLMNDSESSDDEENTAISHSKVVNDKYTKISSLFNNSVVKGKHIEKEDTASSSKLSMNDSESSDEEENTTISHSKVVNDKHTKVSSLFNNNKHIKGKDIEKEDTASSSKLPMNDSESSDEEENTAISHSKVVNDKYTKVSSLFNNNVVKGKHIEKEDTASSSKLLMNDSESSDEEENTTISHSKDVNDKCTKVSPLFDNSKHIRSPLFSSTPVSGSENSVNNINLIRNKQLEQLHKYLAKNRLEKQILVDSIKTRDQFSEENISQSLNNSENVINNINNGNKYNLLDTLIKNNDNSIDVSRINQEGSLPNDSGISGDECKQFQIQNSFLNMNKRSTKTIKKNKSSDKIVNTILHSFSPNKQQSKTNKTKNNLSVGFNMNHSSNDEEGNVYTQPMFSSDEKNSVYTQRLPVQDLINSNEKNSVYTQHAPEYNNSDEKNSVYTQHVKQLINSSNSDEEILNNYKPKIKTSSTLNFSTKSISESITHQEKDKNKTDYKHSNITTLAMLSSDSESNNEDIELPIKVKNHEMSFEREIKNNTTNNLSETKINIINTQYSSSSDGTSSDDDIYTKLKQNISKSDVTDSVNYTTNNDNNLLKNKNKSKEKNEKCTLQMSVSCSNDKNIIITNDGVTKHISEEDSSNDDEIKTDYYNTNKDNNMASNEKTQKKENKIKPKKDKSILQSPKCSSDIDKLLSNIIGKRGEIIKHIIKENLINDEVKTDNYNINKFEKQNQTKQTKSEPVFLKSQNLISKKDEMIKYILDEETSTDDDVNADISNIDNCNLSLNKNKLKKQNKNKQEKDNSAVLQLSRCNNDKSKLSQNENSRKDAIVKHILKGNISDDDEVKTDISNINNYNLPLNKNKQKKDKSKLLQLSKCNSDKIKLSQNVISKKDAIIQHILKEEISSDDEVKSDISNINKNLSILSNKKKQNKINQGKDKSMLLQSPMHSNDKSKLSQNLISKELYKNELIKQILKEDSSTDDEMKCTSSSVLQSNQNTFKNSSNPFIKSYAADVHTSSSEDDTVNINLIKSKDKNALSKKKSITLIKKGNKKNDLIKEVLKSMKHQNKKYKHKSVKHIDSNYLEDSKQLSKMEKIEKCKPRVEDKKSCLKNLKTSVEEPRFNTSVQNNNNVLKMQIQPSTDDSTNDEIDVIKQIIEKKQKSNKINKTESLELTIKNDISTKLNKNKSSEKLDKIIKPQETSISTDELINNIIKTKTKKRPNDTKDLLLHGIINTIEDSSSSFVPTKKKKKDHNLIETTNYVSDGNLPKKKKKKKTKLFEDINLNDLTMQDNQKKKNDLSIFFEQQDMLSTDKSTNSIDIFKKKVKKLKSDTNKLSEINNTLIDTNVKNKKTSIATDELINNVVKKKKKKRLNDTKDLLLGSITNTIEDSSSSIVPTKMKKKDHNLIETTNDVSDGNLPKIKKKKKITKLFEDINLDDLTMQDNQKKKNDSSIFFEQQDILSRDKKTNSIDIFKKKVKKLKSDTNKFSEINDTLTDTNEKNEKSSISIDELINNIIQKKKKKRLNDSKDLLLDGITNTIKDSKKKKKDHNLIETNDVSDGNLLKVKKKKKKIKLPENIE